MFILGKKLKMSQIWKDKDVIPVTIVKAEPNKVSLIRTKDKNGYEAVQLSLGKSKKEFRVKDQEIKLKVGDNVDVSFFKEGDRVKVSSNSKGKGFQGVVKRHRFHGGPKTHGQKDRLRAPGSIGSTGPQRVFPGRKMAGRMGNERITIRNLKIAKVDKESNLLMLKGAVPGMKGSLLEIVKQ